MIKKNPEYVRVMERAGFYFDGKPIPTVIEADSLHNPHQVDNNVKYKSLLDSEKSHTVSVYELSGSPCIYFAQLSESHPTADELSDLRRSAWNRGGAPLLWVITPAKVLIYNCYARPALNEQNDADTNLLQLFQQTEAGLKQLNEFAGRLEIESGRFWQRPEARKIDREGRVDQSLLRDLNEAEQQLTGNQLHPVFAHALLGRAVFIAYLQDRGILKPQFFRSNYAVENFAELLSYKTKTYHFFRWIRRTFNGDLFPLTRKRINRKSNKGRTVREEDRVTPQHLATIQSLISSTEVATGQARLWPYDFSIIPVELISSIYENFAYSGDSKSARARSTHYTPFPLVDLVLGQVMETLQPKAKILDMACGSGVFLVECLRRLVVKRILEGEELDRKLIRETLHEQIFGIDISKEAVQIAAFSLYLTALELDPKPQPPSALKFRKLIGRNLFAANAFDETADFNSTQPFVNKSFDAIVGNPPWKSGRKSDHRLLLEYCKKRNRPLTRNTPDQAFLWRTSDWAADGAQIGMILHGKPFFAHTPSGRTARRELFQRFRPKVIINLADLRLEKLFPHSAAPALIFIGAAIPPDEDATFTLVAPKKAVGMRRHGLIKIEPEDIKTLRVSHLISDPDLLKVASWGSARDFALIRRLRNSYASLEEFATLNGCIVGQGFQKAGGTKEAKEMYGKPFLAANALSSFEIDVATLPVFEKQGLHRSRNISIYKGPLVITVRGLAGGKFASAFCNRDVVYPDTYLGISFANSPIRLAHFLNGVANSRLANYFLFLTSSVWGVERDEVKPNDVLRLPLPSYDDKIVQRIVDLETELRTNLDTSKREQFIKQLNEAVYELYELDESERALVDHILDVTLDLKIKNRASSSLKGPTIEQLQNYARQTLAVIQPFLHNTNRKLLSASILDVGNAPLCIVKFMSSLEPTAQPLIAQEQRSELQSVLAGIAKELPAKVASQIYAQRALRIYLDNLLCVVKPAEYRYWTRAAALSDADAILAEHQEDEDYIEPNLAGRSTSPSQAILAA